MNTPGTDSDFKMHSPKKGSRDLRDMADYWVGKNLENLTVPKCKENAQKMTGSCQKDTRISLKGLPLAQSGTI